MTIAVNHFLQPKLSTNYQQLPTHPKTSTMKVLSIFLFQLLSIVSMLQAQTGAAFRLANIFGDNMVLQRGIDVPVWGTAVPGQKVSVEFLGHTLETKADPEGKWLVKLPPQIAGGPYQLKAVANQTIVLNNVMVGEVWLASGQSNMQFQVNSSTNAKAAIAGADHPDIRLFTVPFDPSVVPRDDIKANDWHISSSRTVPYFSAAAYFFALNLHETLKVPIGIIHASKGGTPAEAWTSGDLLLEMPEFSNKMLEVEKDPKKWDAMVAEIRKADQQRARIRKTAAEGIRQGVHQPDFNDDEWQVVTYPVNMPRMNKQGYWGFVWVRKEINLKPKDMLSPLQLTLPISADEYILYVNGTEVQKGAAASAAIRIPANILKPERNVLSIRLLSSYGKARIGENEEKAVIASRDGKVAVSLEGGWKFSFDIEPKMTINLNYFKTPSVLYNGMIAPLMPFGIKGVIWYQGEANTVNPRLYENLFPAMIEDWRKNWEIGAFPFVWVQLAGYSRTGDEDMKWALLRESQSKTLKIRNTAMATAIDIGEAKDIHPKNKEDVGERLALAVRKLVYKENIVHSGPVFKDMQVKEHKAMIKFSNTGSGLISKDGKPLREFLIAGGDSVFYPAHAVITGDHIVVSSKDVSDPVAVRYAFRSFPDVNLYNKEGLPALPFRTDTWTHHNGITIPGQRQKH